MGTGTHIKRTYLGDGVYADFDGLHVVLSAKDDDQNINIIYLEQSVLDAVVEFGNICFGGEIFDGKEGSTEVSD